MSLVFRKFSEMIKSSKASRLNIRKRRDPEKGMGEALTAISSLFHSTRWHSNISIAPATPSVFLPQERRIAVCLYNFGFARSWSRIAHWKLFLAPVPLRKITAAFVRAIFRGILISRNILSDGMLQVVVEITPKRTSKRLGCTRR